MYLRFGRTPKAAERGVYELLLKHFAPATPDGLTISERRFPMRVRADLQRAVDRCLAEGAKVQRFCGVLKRHAYEGVSLSELLAPDPHSPAVESPPRYEEVDIGEGENVRCLKNGLWLLQIDAQKVVLFLEPAGRFGRCEGMRFQVASLSEPAGLRVARKLFAELEAAIASSECYRGKILSLEQEDDYSGASSGITVHKLRHVDRDQVILPPRTLSLLERNVIQFVGQRDRLRGLGMSTKKGLLFYGPPGTGKTHTIHYLARGLPGHTTLLISAEQVGLLGDYMTLARLLQPSIVVLEDVDLIARDRASMDGPRAEALLNKLLNEIDGLKEDADILFILTTNRPEALEAALSSRPGRIDQAIEFPLPDEGGRRKLIALYRGELGLDGGLVDEVVRRTDGVSAAFIKELMRRTAQFALERDGGVNRKDVEAALDEMLFKGGLLNQRILGFYGAAAQTQAEADIA